MGSSCRKLIGINEREKLQEKGLCVVKSVFKPFDVAFGGSSANALVTVIMFGSADCAID